MFYILTVLHKTKPIFHIQVNVVCLNYYKRITFKRGIKCSSASDFKPSHMYSFCYNGLRCKSVRLAPHIHIICVCFCSSLNKPYAMSKELHKTLPQQEQQANASVSVFKQTNKQTNKKFSWILFLFFPLVSLLSLLLSVFNLWK